MSWEFFKISHKKALDQREKHSVVTDTWRSSKSKDAGFPDFPTGIATTATFDRSMSKSRGEAIYTESYYMDFPQEGSLSVRANLTEEPLETHPRFGKDSESEIKDSEWLQYRKYQDGESSWQPSSGSANFQVFWNLKKKGINGFLSSNIEAQVTVFENIVADSSKVGKQINYSLLPTFPETDKKNWILFAVNGQKEGATGKWKNTYVFKASGYTGWDEDLYKSDSINLQKVQEPNKPSESSIEWKLVRTDKRYDDRQGQDLVTDYYEGVSTSHPAVKTAATGAFDRILEYSDGLAKYQESYYVGNQDTLDGFSYNTTLSQEPLETHPRYRTGGDKPIEDSEWDNYRMWQDDPSKTDWKPDFGSDSFKDFWKKKSKGITSWLDYAIELQYTEIVTGNPDLQKCGCITTLPSPRAITLKNGRTWLLVAIDAEKLATDLWRVTKTLRSSADGGWNTTIYTKT
jgi:hypothetical protein